MKNLKEKPKSILVIGRRWFDKANGNTYCASKVYVNGRHVITNDYEYGYGDYYVDAANDALAEQGYIDNPKTGASGLRTPLWRYCDENNIEFNYEVADVLKRDLEKFGSEQPKNKESDS